MSMTDEAASLSDTVEAPVKANNNRKVANSREARKAGKAKTSRQNAAQSDGKASGRKFKLTPTELKEMRAEGGKGFINPYRESSSYHACVAAIRKLGAGRLHDFGKIVTAVIAQMGDAAKEFKAKEARNEETGKDWKARIVQSVKVLARRDYGAKLRQLGFEVRIDTEKGRACSRLAASSALWGATALTVAPLQSTISLCASRGSSGTQWLSAKWITEF